MATLSPLELLSASDAEQSVVRCLTRHPGLTISQLALQSGVSMSELEPLLAQMVGSGHLVEQLKEDRRVFSVRFGFARRRVRNMPVGIMELLAQTTDDFLADTELLNVLADRERDALLAQSVTRRVVPDEVLAWQGEAFGYVGVLRAGLLQKVQLRGKRARKPQGYMRRGEWIGLGEAFTETAVPATYTAMTESELLLWPVETFLDYVTQHAPLGAAVAGWLGRQLVECRTECGSVQSKLWAVAGLKAGDGVSTVAAGLAGLSLTQTAAESDPPRVLLWDVTGRDAQVAALAAAGEPVAGETAVVSHPAGFDILQYVFPHDYPPQVQLDIQLTKLRRQYDYVICDTGAATNEELYLRLRGRADTLLTLTTDPEGAEAGLRQWQQVNSFAHPGQKRVLTLNRHDLGLTEVDSRFQLVLPQDAQVSASQIPNGTESRLNHALQEVHRRLSLDHAISIFVPSTMEVDQTVDNEAQVQSALAFFGTVFGGATSSDAEGVWRSEDSELVTEQVTIVRTFVSRQAMESHLDAVIDFAHHLKKEMQQEAVAVGVDNELILV